MFRRRKLLNFMATILAPLLINGLCGSSQWGPICFFLIIINCCQYLYTKAALYTKKLCFTRTIKTVVTFSELSSVFVKRIRSFHRHHQRYWSRTTYRGQGLRCVGSCRCQRTLREHAKGFSEMHECRPWTKPWNVGNCFREGSGRESTFY